MAVTTRTWTSVLEIRRRERHIHDLLARSGSTRLHRRVTMAPADKRQWKRDERTIVQIERSIRSIDPVASDFWTEFRMLEELLVHRYHQLGITLHR